ncbi:MAG TPA: alpha-L-fucosidase C-terminal domain-containing protein [Terriglobia bacterium]|nr:alpha-L-fucosidase C-terminal domain-containing protein [Terriglobia bacterium]
MTISTNPASNPSRFLPTWGARAAIFCWTSGPTPEATIQLEFAERLRGIGKWPNVNGDSIYGTTYGPLQNLPFGRITAKGNMVYLHVFDWPSTASLRLNGLSSQVSAATVLVLGEKLQFKQENSAVTISVPPAAPDPYDTVIRIQVWP